MQDKSVNVFFVTDRQNLENLYVSIKMLLSNADKSYRYNIYILYNKILESEKITILSIGDIFPNINSQVIFHQVNENDFITPLPQDTPHTSKVGRFKYIIGNFDINKALYIDTDILLRVDVSLLFNVNLNNDIIAAVPDVNNRIFNNKLRLQPDFNYFNSGVLLINCEKWREFNITEQLLRTSILREKDIIYVDQDTFNIVFSKIGYKKLPLEWNFPSANQYFKYNLLNYIKKYWRVYSIRDIFKAFKNPYLVHFIGKPKPNEGNTSTPYANEYLDFITKTSMYREIIK